MEIIVRSINEAERVQFIRTAGTVFGSVDTDEDIQRFVESSRLRNGPERMFAAFAGNAMVATSLSFPTTMSVAGPADLPLGWIFAVATLPSHRRGIMTNVLTTQLRTLRDEGLSIAGLASQTGHYRRLGFGVGAACADLRFGASRALLKLEQWPHAVEFTQVLDVDQLSRLHEQACRTQVGEVKRDAKWWKHDSRQHRGNVYLRSASGDIVGWAAYAMQSSGWATDSRSHLEVQDFIAPDPSVRRALWQIMLGFDTAHTITVRSIPIDDPIFRMLAQPTSVEVTRKESPWLRILDVSNALTARTYNGSFTVTIAVRDDIFSENNATFRLSSQDGADTVCEQAEGATEDLTVDIADLASALNGHASFRQLADAGRVATHEPNSIDKLTRAFATPSAAYCSLFIV